eukprot:8195447-Ditylum_brightwellii.AAC.1
MINLGGVEISSVCINEERKRERGTSRNHHNIFLIVFWPIWDEAVLPGAIGSEIMFLGANLKA